MYAEKPRWLANDAYTYSSYHYKPDTMRRRALRSERKKLYQEMDRCGTGLFLKSRRTKSRFRVGVWSVILPAPQ